MPDLEDIDVFGKFLVENLRDVAIDEAESIISGKSLSLNSYEMTQKLERFNEEDLDLIKELIKKTIDFSLREFLYEINTQEESKIKILVNDVDLNEIEPFLQGKLNCDDGWIDRFSEYRNH
jgi:hypothetical protein